MSKMLKNKTVFICNDCGQEYGRWQGKCSACGAWNTIEESEVIDSSPLTGRTGKTNESAEIIPFHEVSIHDGQRKSTGLPTVDTVLGGGIVTGSFLLIAGEPGVGKSTLMLELSRNFKGKFYYFSGEESPEQIRLRAERLGLSGENLYLSRESDLTSVSGLIFKERPELAIIDSIQTLYTSGGSSSPGSPGQLRDAAITLMDVCKSSGTSILTTGHITKEGSVAGPKLLEHMVDAVLYFESDRLNHYRMLRAVKNRFGPVGEAAIFEMKDNGLVEVPDYHGIHDSGQNAAGRVYSSVMEGSRAIVLEVQALVVRSSYGPSRRMADGLDSRRLTLISAVLEKYLHLNLAEKDIFSNLTGGFDSNDTALDLALAFAIISSYTDTSPERGVAYLGEVGLSGEVRPVGGISRRIKELANLGFHKVYIPQANLPEVDIAGMIPVGIDHVSGLHTTQTNQ